MPAKGTQLKWNSKGPLGRLMVVLMVAVLLGMFGAQKQRLLADSLTPAAGAAPAAATASTRDFTYLEITGDIVPVHDPVIIQGNENGTPVYYQFSTAPIPHIAIRRSTDLVNWSWQGWVFSAIPAWVQAAIPTADLGSTPGRISLRGAGRSG